MWSVFGNKNTVQRPLAMMIFSSLFLRNGTLNNSRSFVAAFTSHAHEKLAVGMYGRGTFRIAPGCPLKMSQSMEEENSSDPQEESPGQPSSAAVQEYVNRNNIRDQVFSAISSNGQIKVTAATCRNVVNELIHLQGMTELSADAMGRLVTCALLMSNGIQEEQIVQLGMIADGPLRGSLAISNGKGEVRGYVGNPSLDPMDLKEAVGKGSVQVVKNHPDWPRPYNGITSIRSGDIDRDVGIYLAESEQRSCALAAATSVQGILCKAAGGYLVEQMPGCDEETIKAVEQNLAKLVEADGTDKLPTGLLKTGVTPLDIAETILDGLEMKPLQQIEPTFRCQCTEDRLVRSLSLLPREEVDDIIAKEEQIEARCQFCGRVYRMGPEEVARRLEERKNNPDAV